MKFNLPFLVFSVLIAACASSKPKTCTPLTGGFDLVSSYEGDCQRLTFHGEDLSLHCSSVLFVNERRKNRFHSVVFQTRTPRGIVAFNGVPHRKTSKIYFVKVDKVVRSEHPAEGMNGKPNIVGHKDSGICDVEILPGENIRVICSAKDSDGKMSMGEFKTVNRTLISCMEQFPDHQTQK